MTPFEIIAVLLSLTALGGYINFRYMRLPSTIGSMVFALLVSMLAITMDKTGLLSLREASEFVRSINLPEVLLHGMLAFLLFAGALHIHFDDLRDVKVVVTILATIGVVLATAVTGTLVWLAAQATGIDLPYVYALLFGALISPTDPIAVMAMLKEAGLSKTLYTKIGTESLFNDGVGVVVFLTIFEISGSPEPFSIEGSITLLAREALGGIALGLLLGWITFQMLRSIDEYKVEILLTFALAAGGYALAEVLHVSAPLCTVAAGLIVGNHGRELGMSERTRQHLDIFWELTDDILNAVLFILIGLEIVIIPMHLDFIEMGIMSIAAVLIGRIVSVGAPIKLLSMKKEFERGTIKLLTWGGLRGGLSIAMALSLPEGPYKNVIIPVTYMVVLFSILVQGLTFPKLVSAVLKQENKTTAG